MDRDNHATTSPGSPATTVSLVGCANDTVSALHEGQRAGHLQIISTFDNPLQALESLAIEPSRVVIVEVGLPDTTGISFAQKLKVIRPNLAVIVLASGADGPAYFRALMAGADGFLARPFSTAELLKIINHALQGELCFGRTASRQVLRILNQFRRLTEDTGLSEREEQILACIFQELSDKEIAATLGIGTATVHTHLHRLYEKMGVHSRKDVIARYLDYTGLAESYATRGTTQLNLQSKRE